MKLIEYLRVSNKLINFSKSKTSQKQYTKGTTRKIGIRFNEENYLLKYLEKSNKHHYKNKKETYFNSIYSEYIACNIGKKIGLNIQETLLGVDLDRTIYEYIPCVACKDFCGENENIIHAEQLYTTIQRERGIKFDKKTLKDVFILINTQNYIDKEKFKKYFLDMFVFDSFIGNFDRNPNNWGIVYNKSLKTYRIAPIYDCGSSMHPKTSRKRMKEYIEKIKDKYFLKLKVSNSLNSYFLDDKGGKINYYNFLVEKEFNQDKDIAEAILRVAPKLVEIQENGYIKKLVDGLSELMGEDRAKVLKIELEYKAQHMFKEMIRIANKVLEKEKEQSNSWIKKEIDDDWER